MDNLGTDLKLFGNFFCTICPLHGDYLGTTWAILWALLEEDLGTTWGKLWDYFGNTLAIPLHFWHYKDNIWALFWNNLGITWAIFGTHLAISWLLLDYWLSVDSIYPFLLSIFWYFNMSLKISFVPSILFSVFILPIFRWYPALQTSLLLLWCYLVDCWYCRQNPEKSDLDIMNIEHSSDLNTFQFEYSWTSIVLREASLKQLNLIWKEGWRAPRRRENYVKHLYWHQLIIAKHHHHHRLRTCRKNQLMNVHV